MGLTVTQSAPIVLLLAITVSGIGLWWKRVLDPKAAVLAILVPFAVAAINLAVVGTGLFRYGTSWQGFVNEDGATNAIGAQYFLQHPFFAHLNPLDVVFGRDYAGVASALYVETGHRFADVMLLGVSAALTSLHPDQVYMTHGLMVRVALITTCVSLVCVRRGSVFEAVAATLLLSISSLGAYVYFNQLISQMGGVAFAVLATVLWARTCDVETVERDRTRTVFLLAIVCTALLRYYTEIASVLALAMFFGLFYRGRTYVVANWSLLTKLSAGLLFSIVVASNVSLPQALAHSLSTLDVVQTKDAWTKGLMNYAFTPTGFPLLFGFVRHREDLDDPLASVLIMVTALLALVAIVALFKRRGDFPALSAMTIALLVTFAVLWLKGEEFGTYKALLLLQPFAVIVATVVVASLFRSYKRIALLLIAMTFGALNLRVTVSAAQAAISDITPIPNLARGVLLDRIESLSKGALPTKLDLQSFLLQYYSMSRLKEGGGVFEVGLPVTQSRKPTLLGKFHEVFHNDWFRHNELFDRVIDEHNASAVRHVTFGCGIEPLRSAQFELRNTPDNEFARIVYAGGTLQPYNRVHYANADFIVHEYGGVSLEKLLVQRESTLGLWEVRSHGLSREGERSTFLGEGDPIGQVHTISAVGRYILLEIIGSGSNEVSVRLRFTRSFFGGTASKIPPIRLQGETSTVLGGHGGGAMEITSDAILPCTVSNRKFIFIDFGAEPQTFQKRPPLVYRSLDVPYTPDSRRSVGFLRDASVASGDEVSKDLPWAPKRNGEVAGYVGLYEDGWISDDARIDLRVEDKTRQVVFLIEVDPSLLPSTDHMPRLVVKDKKERALVVQILKPGTNRIVVPSKESGSIRLTVDHALELPNDGRLVAGRLVGITLEP
jgi:hypothetical protein